MPFFLSADLALRSVEFPALIVALAVLWLLFLGGSVGSFLNVVVYRLPLGMSLVHPRSRCPRCGTPILIRDNLPVVGWLLLRGKCRACRGPISARYPLVEFTTAITFLALAMAEPLGGGWNLPIPQGPASSNYPLWGSLFLHFALVSTLMTAALIAYDGEAVPRRMWQLVWLCGMAAAAAWPMLRPVPMLLVDRAWGPAAVGLLEGLAGSLLGAALGAASWPASSTGARGRTGHRDGIAAGAVVGAFLGWQAAAVVVFAAALLWSTWQLLRYVLQLRFDLSWLAFLWATTLAWLFVWRFALRWFPELGAAAPWYLPPSAVAATLVVTWAGRTLADTLRRRPH